LTIPFTLEGADQEGSTAEGELYNPLIDGREGGVGQNTYTQPRFEPYPVLLPFINATYGNAINQDASAGGTPVNINDGGDNVYWTGSSIIGSSVDFTSTTQAFSGTQSVRANSPSLNDVWEFDKGSSQDLTNYSSITGQIYVNRRWTAGDSVAVFGYDSGTASTIGNQVLLEDYIDEFTFGSWQGFAIPLSDMGLTGETIDAFRFMQVGADSQTGDFFLDIFRIEETGTGIEFKTFHEGKDIYLAKSLVVSLEDALSGTLADGAGITPFNPQSILGVSSLTIGLNIKIVKDGIPTFSGTVSTLSDLMAIGFKTTNQWSNGTNSMVTFQLDFSETLFLRRKNTLDYVSVTVNDDLSGLTRFNATLRGATVPR